MHLIDGKKVSQEILHKLKTEVDELKKQGKQPGLATILVGNDPASNVYVASKIKACKELGINSFHNPLSETATEDEIVALIEKLNKDKKVSAILLQLPLPAGKNTDRCINAIDPQKDADGLHPFNIGKLVSAKSWKEIEKQELLMPCTPFGIIELLKSYNIEVSGKKAIVVGRSNLVGKPIAMLLLANDATVTMAHSRTKDLAKICSEADIVVAAIGKDKFVKKDFVKKGAVVIDVGINRTEKGLCGDVDFEAVKDLAGYITPVPGGVGKMTIAMLMKNTVMACRKNG